MLQFLKYGMWDLRQCHCILNCIFIYELVFFILKACNVGTSLVVQWLSLPTKAGDTLEKEMATHSSTFAWKIPWMEEPRRLQSVGWQRVRHDGATSPSPVQEIQIPPLIQEDPTCPRASKLMNHNWVCTLEPRHWNCKPTCCNFWSLRALEPILCD